MNGNGQGQATLPEEKSYEPVLQQVPVDKIIPTGPSTGSVKGQKVKYTIITLREKGEGYEVGDGNQRIREVKEKGDETVWAWVYPSSTPDLIFYSDAVVRNYRRRRNPIHEGEMVVALVNGGYSIKGIAKLLGTSVSVVETLIGIARLPEEIKAAGHEGKIAPSTMRLLAKMKPDKVAQALDILHDTGKLTASNVKDLRRREVRQRMATVPLFTFTEPSPKEKIQQQVRSLLHEYTKEEIQEWVSHTN
ncbi:chromosome partitioning protein ParB-like protein [Virus Rctr71]|nr:chromosome partitioning protein ParB-like protein [Virus Rctr71]